LRYLLQQTFFPTFARFIATHARRQVAFTFAFEASYAFELRKQFRACLRNISALN
jgi:hypothetical protein